MKKNYFKLLIVLPVFMISLMGYSQNIQISIVNAEVTGTDPYYYEADVVIQTIDGQPDFKLGAGQMYFNYNSIAFGEKIVEVLGNL